MSGNWIPWSTAEHFTSTCHWNIKALRDAAGCRILTVISCSTCLILFVSLYIYLSDGFLCARTLGRAPNKRNKNLNQKSISPHAGGNKHTWGPRLASQLRPVHSQLIKPRGTAGLWGSMFPCCCSSQLHGSIFVTTGPVGPFTLHQPSIEATLTITQ